MLAELSLITVGIAARQPDRWWFSPRRGHPQLDTLRDVMHLQRQRINNFTPALLLIGHWLEIAGWCLIAAHHGWWGWGLAALAGAVKMRHLQEVSHFAVHGVLTRSSRLSTLLAEATVHLPLGFVPVPVRQQRHVREHHPNATVAGADPNLADLHDAGMHPGVSTAHFLRATLYPLTLSGLTSTLRGITSNLRTSPAPGWRTTMFLIVPIAIGWTLGWQAVVFVFVIPRLLLYPQLAWMSLLVEHRWFDAEPVTGPPAVVEAARCLRLYPRNPVLALLARATWLPYGDLYHYAHSAHPAVRWNYLPALERVIGSPAYTPDALVLGKGSVLRRHHVALAAQHPQQAHQRQLVRSA